MPLPSHPARRALVAAGPGDTPRQGGRLTSDPGRSPVSRASSFIGHAGLLLGLFGLASMGLGALRYLTLPAAVAASSPAPATERAGMGPGE